MKVNSDPESLKKYLPKFERECRMLSFIEGSDKKFSASELIDLCFTTFTLGHIAAQLEKNKRRVILSSIATISMAASLICWLIMAARQVP